MIVVELDVNNPFSLLLYPNPASPIITILFVIYNAYYQIMAVAVIQGKDGFLIESQCCFSPAFSLYSDVVSTTERRYIPVAIFLS